MLDDHYEPVEYDSGENGANELGSIHSTLEKIHSTLEEIHSALESKDSWSGAVWIVIVVLLLVNWSGSKLDRWTDRVWYSLRYGAEWKNVNIEKRPLDCDFFHAPLGDKGCHYKKSTITFADEQRRTLMEQATTPEERENYSRQPNSVTLYWEKKQE